MATTLTTTVASAAEAATMPMVNKLFSQDIIWERLWKKAKVSDGGLQINIPAAMSKPSAGGKRNKGEQVTFASTDFVQTPALDWGHYWQSALIPEEDISQASGRHRLLDRVAIETDRMIRDMQEDLGTDFWAGAESDSPLGLIGVNAWCITTGTYAGINVATVTNWAGNYDTAEADVTDLELLTTYIPQCTKGRDRPTHIVTPIGLLGDAIKDLTTVTYQKGGGEMEAGASGFKFYGIDWEYTDLIPASSMYLLNLNYIDAYVPDKAHPIKVRTFDESEYPGIKLRITIELQIACRWPKFCQRIAGVSTISKA